MGYDLHITRARSWPQNASEEISAAEWLAYVQRDPELSLFPENGPYFTRWSGKSNYPDPWLDWSGGNIHTKNSDAALLNKMVAIARELGARVQGDDGEIYRSAEVPPIYPKPSALDRVNNWFRALRPAPPVHEIVSPFQAGDRVLDAFNKEATVIEIAPRSNHGLGKVRVRYDDGREAAFMLAASGLTPIDEKKKKS